ncbi:TraB/GumN family protein [Roseateles aquatilis]|nr:TraB/GumN family protein [Roseateles aquatilis]
MVGALFCGLSLAGIDAAAQPAWQLERDGHHILLVGTQWLGQSSDQLDPEVQARVGQARLLLVQTDDGQLDGPAVPLPDPRADPRTLAALVRACDRWDPRDEAETGARGVLGGLACCIEAHGATLGLLPRHGTRDLVLAAFRAHGHHAVEGLETVASGLLHVDSIPFAEAVREVEQHRPTAASIAADRTQLRRASRSSTDDALAALVLADQIDPTASPVWAAMNAARATAFLARILQASGRTTALAVALDVAHLFGPNGLLKQLEAVGFRVTRIPPPSSEADSE